MTTRSRNPKWEQVVRHSWYLTIYRELGTLYLPDWERTEAPALRSELEAAGVPMGYGRVGRTPLQLDDGEARAQFRHH